MHAMIALPETVHVSIDFLCCIDSAIVCITDVPSLVAPGPAGHETTDDCGIYATQEVNGNVSLLRNSAPFQSKWITFSLDGFCCKDRAIVCTLDKCVCKLVSRGTDRYFRAGAFID